MPRLTPLGLLDRLRAERELPRTQLRFSLCMEKGWIQGDEHRVRLCADLYNAREDVETGLRLVHALRANPTLAESLLSLECDCGGDHDLRCLRGAAIRLRETE